MFSIRPIEQTDCARMAHIIRTVMTAYGASGEGFSIMDPEVDDMFFAYQANGHRYFVITNADGEVFGGSGIAPLTAEIGICELRKMYILPEVRGKGLGAELMAECLQFAISYGYSACYLETLKTMTEAEHLYKKSGFEPIHAPLGNTGHGGCDAYYIQSFTQM